MSDRLAKIDYQVVHSNPGRIRIGVPHLKDNLVFANKLEQLLNSLDFVVRVRINHLASSIAIRYEASAISSDRVREQIAACIQQAATRESRKNEAIQQSSGHSEKQHTELSAKDEEELAGKIGLEVVGEVIGEAVGEILLGSIGGIIASRVMGKVGGLVGESIHRQVVDVAGLLEHVGGQAKEEQLNSLTNRVGNV